MEIPTVAVTQTHFHDDAQEFGLQRQQTPRLRTWFTEHGF